MNRSLRRCSTLSLLLVLVLAACGGGGSSPTEPALRATFLGTVHESGKETLIPGVVIEAQGARTTTDAGGAFVLRDLQPVQTTVTLTKDGYRPTTIGVNLVAGDNRFSIAMSTAP